MRMTLQPDLADLAPGDEAEFHVAMANDGADDVEVELELQGLDADLWTLANPIPVIPAGQVGRTTIRVRLPEDATPGERRISVSVRNTAGTVGASAAAALRVGSNDVIAIETDPASVTGKKGAKLDTIVRNRGDDTLRLRVSGHSDGASVTIRPAEFDLPPGKGARLKARIERNQRSWFKERRHGLVLDVRGGTVPATTSAIFVQKPIVPPVLLRSVAVLVALAVWASATFVLFSRMSANDEVAAPVAPTDTIDPNAPPPPVLLAGDVPVEDDGTVAPPLVIAGAVEGPRDLAGTAVTIERVSFGDEGTTDGSTGKVAPLTPVAVTSGTVLDKITATTDEKGRFRVASGLVMGAFYRVTAQRSGFDLRSQVVSITEETPEIELAMSLVPGRGVMSGRIVDTEGNPVGGATIAATQGSITYRTTTASTGDAIGSWSLEGLATPSTYLITVAAVGYASQQLTVEVGGGATVAGVDAELTRDRGTIRGRITYRDTGVGAVTVALEGEVSRTTTTLTIGDLKGSFDFPNLPYGTYLLTFSAPGWLTSSREVNVTTGDVPVDVKDLLPSTAIVQGVVAQQVVDGGCDYPDPTAAAAEIGAGSCGGVGVSVIGENGVWSTTTATGDGSFRISGVPAGEYTVRFERYGYLPEFYKVVIGPGDVITLPDDATYDVEMAAYIGPRNRVLEPLSTESVQLRLVPTTALDAGRVTGIVRDAFDVDTDFDAAFPDWSGGCRDERVDVVVLGQPDAVCVLSAGGGFELLGVAAGAADLVINAPGFGTYTTTIQVAPEGETQAGLIPLTPLASLILNVTGTGDVPVQDAVVFVAPTDPTVPVFKGEAAVRECTVTRADANDLWRERSTVPDGHQSKVGLCGDADSAGDVSFARGLGTGSFDVILPVNGADPTDAAVLAGTVPMDHRQLSRSIDVQVGESARLDLRLRRYASIVGTIQVPNPTGTGYTNLTALDGLASFPAMGVDPNDPNAEEGIEFCEIDANDACVAYDPTYVTPRVSFGSAAGLAPGQFRINRIPPNEGTLLREYRIRIETDEGSFERSPSAGGGVEGLAFGEERTLSAVASPGPTDIEIAVVWNDGSGTLRPVTGALVNVTGTAGFRTLDVAPFREELILSCPGPECDNGISSEDGFPFSISPAEPVNGWPIDAEGRLLAPVDSSGQLQIGGVYRTGTLTVIASADGFDTATESVALRSAATGYDLILQPSPKEVTGTVNFNPSTPVVADSLIEGLTATLTPVRGGTPLSTALTVASAGVGEYSFPAVRPASYTLRISGTGVSPSVSAVVIAPSTSSTVTPAPVAVNRSVTLNVAVGECVTGSACASLTAVPGATVQLEEQRLSPDLVPLGSPTLIATAVSCADTNAAECAGLGVATFSGLVASPTIRYRVVAPTSPKLGYRLIGAESSTEWTALTSLVTSDSIEIQRFGSVSGRVVGKVSETSSTSSGIAGATVTLTTPSDSFDTTTDSTGRFTFPFTLEIPDSHLDANVQDNIPGTPHFITAVSADGYRGLGTSVAVPRLVGPGAANSADVTVFAEKIQVSGTITDPVSGRLLEDVRVSVLGTNCPDVPTDVPANLPDGCAWSDQDGDFTIEILPQTTTLKFEEFRFDGTNWTLSDRPTVERSVVPSVGQNIDGFDVRKPPALGGITGSVRIRDYEKTGGSTGAGSQALVKVVGSGSTCPGVEAPSTTTTTPPECARQTVANDGTFVVTNIPAGTYNLEVSLAGYQADTYLGVVVVANGSATVPVITLNALPRDVEVAFQDGANSAVAGLEVRATPPSDAIGLSAVDAGDDDRDGDVILSLTPGQWALSSTNGSSLSPPVIDFSGHSLAAVPSPGASLSSPLETFSFVTISGLVDDAGGSPLSGAEVSITRNSVTYTATTAADGTWTMLAPPNLGSISFDVQKFGFSAEVVAVSVGAADVSASTVTLQALPGRTVTVSVLSTSIDGNGDPLPVVGATVVATPSVGTPPTAVSDASGDAVLTNIPLGSYTISVADTNGLATGATDHLAFGPLNPVTGADLGTGPRSITVDANTGAVTIVLQKLDTALTGSVGTATDNALAGVNGALVTAQWSSGARSATVTTTLAGSSISGISVASDRPWTVSITQPDPSPTQPATRSIAAGDSGDLGRVTLSTGERTVSGTLTGPAGRTVTITASANGFAERSVTRSVAIDAGTVTYSLPGLSADVTWRIDFTVAGTTVSRWVGPGSTPVELDQTVGADAVASIRVVVVDTAETAARTTPLTVTLRLDESTTPGSSTTTTQPLSESVAGGATTSTVTLVAGQTSAEHTFGNLVKASATTNGLLEDRFSVTVTTGTGYAVDVAASATLTGLDPENQTLLVALDPAVRTVTATLLDSLGTSSTGDDAALGSRRVTLTRTMEGATSTIVGTADPSTTNLYTFSGILPGTWSLATDGFGAVPVLVPVETADPASSHDAGTLRLLSSVDRLDASTVVASPTEISAGTAHTSTITVTLIDGDTPLSASGGVIRLFTDHGSLGSATDNNNGTYTATYTAPVQSGVATIMATLDGVALSSVARVTVVPGAVSASRSSVTSNRTSLTADGSSVASISVTLRDEFGNLVTSAPSAADLSIVDRSGTTAQSLSFVNGVATATYTAPTEVGTAVFSATIDGTTLDQVVTLNLTAGAADATTSTVTVNESAVAPDGSSTTVVTVTLKDENSNPLSTSGGTVVVSASGGGAVGTVTDNRDGTYTAVYTAGTSAGSVTISATIGGTAVSDTATVTLQATLPGQPTGLTPTVADGEIGLSWGAPTNNGGSDIVDYIVEYRIATSSAWTVFDEQIVANTSTTVTGLVNDTQYEFRVTAVNTIGAGPASTPVTATPITPPATTSG